MKIRIILALFVFCFFVLINNVNAEPAYTGVQGENMDLKVSCFDTDNDFCDDATDCEITIFKPDQLVLVNNQSMEYMGTYFNYSLSSDQNDDIGVYSAVVRCEGSTIGYTTFNYEIVEKRGSFLQSYLYIIIIIIWVGLLLGLALKQDLLVGLMGIGLTIVGLFIIQNGFVGYNNDITDIFGILNLFTGLGFFLHRAFTNLEELPI